MKHNRQPKVISWKKKRWSNFPKTNLTSSANQVAQEKKLQAVSSIQRRKHRKSMHHNRNHLINHLPSRDLLKWLNKNFRLTSTLELKWLISTLDLWISPWPRFVRKKNFRRWLLKQNFKALWVMDPGSDLQVVSNQLTPAKQLLLWIHSISQAKVQAAVVQERLDLVF